MSFLTPLALAAGLLAAPIIALYMLRLRRREVTVSSTMLWQQVLLDREANTPWQRLKRNLLLLLQLLILAALVLALARPFIVVPAVSAGQIALLLDASASMNATDSSDGSRFAEAQRKAQEIVDTLSAGDTMTVIRVADVPEVLAPYSGDRTTLHAAIASAQPSEASADWSAALTLAAAGAAGATDFNMVLLSDGGLGAAATLPAIPGKVQLIPVGTSSANVAISALATRALPGQAPELYAQVTNYGDRDAPIVFDLRVDGQLFTAERYTIQANSSQSIVSQALPQGFKTLQAGLTIPTGSSVADDLPEDNTAWAVSTGAGDRRVLIMSSDGNYFIDQVLRSLPGLQVFDGDTTRGLPSQTFDLYIFDGWLPSTLPNGDMLIIDPPDSSPLFTVGAITEATGSPRVHSEDARMTYVDFKTVNLARFKQVTASWAQPLVEADGGPLLLAGENSGRQIAILTFNLSETDLPLQITWPILMANLMDWYHPQDVVYVPDGLKVGESLLLHPPLTADSVRIHLPDGSRRDLKATGAALIFAETQAPGIYTLDVMQGSTVIQSTSFAVNLFDPNESNIRPNTTIKLGETTVAEAQKAEVGQREFWPWLALLGLAILLIEWFAYTRRLHAPTVFRPLIRRGATR